ncbi:MAG: preprotein translocase subunit YajC [Eubacterium sp.]|nr:preprotein translocase subunit YajC [Eubacterium sp.]
MNSLTILTDAAATEGATGGMGIGFIVIYVIFFIGIIYFMFIKPSNKQRQQQEEMAKSIKVGCSIMTTSGFYGTIIGVLDDDTVIVEFGNNKNCRIPMHKKAIAEVEDPDAALEEETATTEEKETKSKLGKRK